MKRFFSSSPMKSDPGKKLYSAEKPITNNFDQVDRKIVNNQSQIVFNSGNLLGSMLQRNQNELSKMSKIKELSEENSSS